MTAFSLKGLARAIKLMSIVVALYLISGGGALIIKEKALAYYSNCSQLAFIVGGGIILLGLFWLSGRDIQLRRWTFFTFGCSSPYFFRKNNLYSATILCCLCYPWKHSRPRVAGDYQSKKA